MKNQLILLTIVLLPTIGAFALPVINLLSVKLRNISAFGFVFTSFILAIVILPAVLTGKTIEVVFFNNLIFRADGLAVFMAFVSSFISAIIALYSFDYIGHYKNQNEYYLMIVLFLGAMMGLVFSANLILMYVFWEITAITSWRLIGFFREDQHLYRANKALLVTAFGSLFMLLGFILLYEQTGSFELPAIKQAVAVNPISNFIVALILIGILSKSATLPFHTWLPDAGVAPAPVTALLHAAVLVKIGVYVFARLFVVTIPIESCWTIIVPVIAGVSALVAGGAALVDTDLKRIIAYSTVSQIGFIFLGLSIDNTIGLTGALLFILMHGLSKAGLFLCAGIVEQNSGTKDITKISGLIHTMPVTAVSFLLCAFSVMGIPPFGGFFSKYMVIAGTLQTGSLTIALVFIFGSVLTILYLFRVFNHVFLGESVPASPSEGSPLMVTCVALFALLSIAAGFLISYPGKIAQSVVQEMMSGLQ